MSDRCDHSGTWIDDAVVVFGGMTVCGDPHVLASGRAARYDPVADEWTELAPC